MLLDSIIEGFRIIIVVIVLVFVLYKTVEILLPLM